MITPFQHWKGLEPQAALHASFPSTQIVSNAPLLESVRSLLVHASPVAGLLRERPQQSLPHLRPPSLTLTVHKVLTDLSVRPVIQINFLEIYISQET